MSKYKGMCTFCGKIGHKAVDCYHSRKKEENNGSEKEKPKKSA